MEKYTKGAHAFVEARDVLLRHRIDYESACREFAWPKLDAFNWAREGRPDATPALQIQYCDEDWCNYERPERGAKGLSAMRHHVAVPSNWDPTRAAPPTFLPWLPDREAGIGDANQRERDLINLEQLLKGLFQQENLQAITEPQE